VIGRPRPEFLAPQGVSSAQAAHRVDATASASQMAGGSATPTAWKYLLDPLTTRLDRSSIDESAASE
jgi:hypothetical protein